MWLPTACSMKALRWCALLVIDIYELVKQYAEKMEYLAASSTPVGAVPGRTPPPVPPEANGVGQRGYKVCEIFGWDIEGGLMPGLHAGALDLAKESPVDENVSAWNNMVARTRGTRTR